MVILFTNDNKNKTVVFYLKEIYGVSHSKSYNVCKTLGFSLNTKFKDLTSYDKRKIEDILLSKNNYLVDSDLRKYNFDNVKRKKTMRNYKGLRHMLNLSVNGQNTQTNAKTQK